MGFIEFTFTEEDGGNETMFDINDDGKIIAIYTYSDNCIESYNEKKDEFIDITKSWKSNSNSLFKHCPKSQIKKYATIMLDDLGFRVSTVNLEEAEYLYNMQKKYNILEQCELYLDITEDDEE